MKEISPEFQNHLNNEVTTLARCWVVEPKVGTAIGFTDHDEDLIQSVDLRQCMYL